MTSSIKDDLKSFRRSWIHHTGMHLATLTVLAATYSVVVFGLSLSLNFKRMLTAWGDGVQMTVYLRDDIDDGAARALKSNLEELREISEVAYVPREQATENFKTQMASYAPDLLNDAEFTNPFPASLRLTLKSGVATDQDVNRLEGLAHTIEAMKGVEDVSYGQSWIHNYSSFVSTISGVCGVLGFILIAGSLFVVGNAIQAAISGRREEIAILELVGATSSMIRRPFVFEGLMMGALAALLALGVNFGLHLWEKSVFASSLVLSRLAPLMNFLSPSIALAFVVGGALLGAFGAWLTVRRINDGWSAVHGLES